MTFYYGAHLSIKKGIIKTIDQAINLNCNLLQIFLSNPMSTKQKLNYTDDECLIIKDKLNFSNTKLVIHLPYVINLSKPITDLKTAWWIKMICEQLFISDKMNSIGCVVHVGKYLDQTISEGLDNMYNALVFIIDFIIDNNLSTYIILETAAGQGTELISTKNNSLEDFANFYNKFTDEQKNHIKICVDTCHIFAAGFDITNKNKVKTFFDQFERLIQIKNLALIHLNDSKKDCGSCVDRHENLCIGKIGKEGIKNFIKYGVYYKIPIILETPEILESDINLIKEIERKYI
jgi:deoxyribonuclease-4